MATKSSSVSHSSSRSASKGLNRIHKVMKKHKRGKPTSNTAKKALRQSH